MKKAIEIEEMRISSNGKHLEFIINCPADYQFTTFLIQVLGNEDIYSIGDSLFKKDGEYITEVNNRFSGQVPVSLFGISKPSIYLIRLEAEHVDCILPEDYNEPDIYKVKNGHVYTIDDKLLITSDYGEAVNVVWKDGKEGEEGRFYYKDEPMSAIISSELARAINVTSGRDLIVWFDQANKVEAECTKHTTECDCEETPGIIEANAFISDVSHVYKCLFDDILSLQAKCIDKETQDRVIRNYLTLYAHQEALRLGYLDEGEKWFHLLDNCFTSKCRIPNKRNINLDCGCLTSRPSLPSHNCGCR